MDGTILIIPMNKLDNQKEMIISKSSVTALATNKNNLLVIAGTYSGECIIFESKGKSSLIMKRALLDHKMAIMSINISDSMNLFITGSNDCCINIYTLEAKPKLLRTILQPNDMLVKFVIHYYYHRHY